MSPLDEAALKMYVSLDFMAPLVGAAAVGIVIGIAAVVYYLEKIHKSLRSLAKNQHVKE